MRIFSVNSTFTRALQLCSATVLLVLAVGCASATQDPTQYTAPEGVTILSEEELRSTIVGNSISGVARTGEEWAEFYVSDGAIRGEQDGVLYEGRWQISGPVICFDYKGAQYDECNTIELNGDQVRYFELDGSPNTDFPTATHVQGNPRGF